MVKLKKLIIGVTQYLKENIKMTKNMQEKNIIIKAN